MPLLVLRQVLQTGNARASRAWEEGEDWGCWRACQAYHLIYFLRWIWSSCFLQSSSHLHARSWVTWRKNPYDVLKLARTTKDFRSLLLNRSSSSIWKAAFSNFPGLPDCPPGMSEPAWANLVFSPRCSVSGVFASSKHHWFRENFLVLLNDIRPKSSMDV